MSAQTHGWACVGAIQPYKLHDMPWNRYILSVPSKSPTRRIFPFLHCHARAMNRCRSCNNHGYDHVSNAARLKPELRLAEAISRFEAHLSTNEKAAFRTQRAKALHSAPGIDDVMRFTAQIDSCIIGKGNRCFGPRFTNILSTVQQFAALGDVVVGGSQNIVACGVWALVRMSIMVSIYNVSLSVCQTTR